MQYKDCLKVFILGTINDKTLYAAVVSDLLRKRKPNGGSTIAIVEAKTTLARVCEVNQWSLYGYGPSFSQNPHPGRN
jgi:hypothetical protein